MRTPDLIWYTNAMATKKTTSKSVKSTAKTTQPKAAQMPEEKKSTTTSTSALKKHKFIVLAVVLLLLAAIYLLYSHQSVVVAATVNGQPIYRYTLLKTSEQAAGPQVLEQLIEEQIVTQEAEKRGIYLSQQDLDQEFEELKSTYKAQGLDIEALMQQSGVTKEEVVKNLRATAMKKKLVENQGINVTEDEVEKFLTANEGILPEDPEQVEAAKKNVAETLKAQKAEQFIQELKAKAAVTYYVGR